MKNYFTKIILLIVVFFMVVAVCFSLVFTSDTKYSDETVYKIVSYLGECGIRVDESIIDIKRKYVIDMDMESITVDKTAVSYNILGNEPSVLAETYTSDTGTVKFQGTQFSFKPTSELGKDIAIKSKLSESGKQVQKLVQGLGFDIDGSNMIISENEGNTHFDITKKAEGLRVFNNCISVEFDDTGVVNIGGRWYYPKSSARDRREAKPVADALILFAQDNVNDKEMEIKSIELGYMLTDIDRELTTLRPVWKIETNTDGNVYIDA